MTRLLMSLLHHYTSRCTVCHFHPLCPLKSLLKVASRHSLRELASRTRLQNSLPELASRTRFQNSLPELASRTRFQNSLLDLSLGTRFKNSLWQLTLRTRFRELASENSLPRTRFRELASSLLNVTSRPDLALGTFL
jgi:ribosomal protein S14